MDLLTGLYEAHLPISDLARSRTFYGETLGLEEGLVDPERGSVFYFIGHRDRRWMLGLHTAPVGPRQHAADRHVAFSVEAAHADAMVDWLADRGIQATGPDGDPIDEPIVHGWMPAAAVFFTDPDGNLLELIAELDATPRPDAVRMPLTRWRDLTG